jgi:hypothetical protein
MICPLDKEFNIPWFYEAVETGALERFRTGQMMSREEIDLMSKVAGYSVRWPNGDVTSIFGEAGIRGDR